MRYEELRDGLRARPEAGTPLPPQEIDLAERRLGSLPEDYRAFLDDFGWGVGPHEVFGLGVDIPPYLDVVRANESEVEAQIEAQVQRAVSGAKSTGSFWGRVTVNGHTVEYRAYTLANGRINVGTNYVVP
jgi:hypothetical protein